VLGVMTPIPRTSPSRERMGHSCSPFFGTFVIVAAARYRVPPRHIIYTVQCFRTFFIRFIKVDGRIHQGGRNGVIRPVPLDHPPPIADTALKPVYVIPTSLKKRSSLCDWAVKSYIGRVWANINTS